MRRLLLLFVSTLLSSSISNLAFGSPLPDRDDGNPYEFYQIDYRWLEIEDIGESLVDLEDNSFLGPISLGFEFPFYGQLYENIWVCSNGMIGFGPSNEYERSDNNEFPDHNDPNNIIAVFWKNLTPRNDWAEGEVFIGVREGRFVVQFQDYPEVNEDGHAPQNTITMQIVLEPDGDITLQYKEIGDDFDLSIGSVGLENRDGSEGLTLRFNGEGVEIAPETAFLLSDHGSGRFLVWDGGLNTPSGAIQTEALRIDGQTVRYLQRRLNQELPGNLQEYEAVFINLGNYGRDGRNYYELTEAEGAILAAYARSGGNIYLEGSDFWTTDQITDAHPLFRIEGEMDGRSAEGPVTGVEGSLADGLVFDDYVAEDNEYVDHLRAIDGAEEVFSFLDRGEAAVGMVSFHGEDYRTIGASFEFGALVDNEGSTKQELIRRILDFFRSPPPEFPRPVNLRAVSADGAAVLEWDMPLRDDSLLRDRLELQHDIAAFMPRNGDKPDENSLAEIIRLREELRELDERQIPGRDDLFGFAIYLGGEEFDFTDSRRYTAIELENGRQYEFAVTAVYRDPDGESEFSDPAFVTPTRRWSPPVNQSFEQHNGSMTAFPGVGGWEWGVPAGGAANGQRAWGTILNGNYPNLANFELRTPQIDIPQQVRTFLTFNHRFMCEGGWDGGRVEYSPDGGERWEVLNPTIPYPEQTIAAFDGGAGYSGNSNGWISATFNLSALAGQRISLRFLFKSDESNVGTGWFIDDLQMFEPQTASLRGSVKTVADQIPIPGARVTLNGAFPTIADTNGIFRIVDIPAGNYQYVISAIGFADLIGNLEFAANQEINREFSLDEYDSRLTVDPEILSNELNSGEQDNSAITLANEGGSPTQYQIYVDYFVQGGGDLLPGPGEAPCAAPDRDDPWELIKTINLTEKTGDRYHIAAEFVRNGTPRDYNLLTTAGDFITDTSHFYLMNRDGDVLRAVPQQDRNYLIDWGVRDLAYDGTSVYGSANRSVFRMSPFTGAVQRTEFNTPLEVNRAIAWVPGEDAFWVGDRDDTWYKYRRFAGGNIQLVDRVTDHGLTGVVGMAWNPSDPDGAYLYIHNQESENGGAAIYRFNPRTHELIRQLETASVEEGFAGGAFTTYLYDTQTWMLGVVIQGAENDFLKLYELWPTRNWVKASPLNGNLNGGAAVDLRIDFDARGIVERQLVSNLEILDVRAGRVTNVTLGLTVQGGACSLEGEITLDDGEGDVQQVTLDLNGTPANPDADGFYSFIDLIPGRYKLTATLPDYFSFESDSFAIAPNENLVRDIQLTHIPHGILQGRIHNEHDENGWLSGVEVLAVNEEDDQISGLGSTDVDGFYSISLIEGSYTITPRLAGWRGETVSGVAIGDGETIDRNFEMDDQLIIHSVRINGKFDDRLQIEWDPPGALGRTDSLRCDDNVIANAVFLRGREDVIAVRFEPEGLYDIRSIQSYMFRRGDFGFNGWVGIYGAVPIHYRIWLEDPETGLPGEEIWNDFDDDRTATRWVNVNVAGLRFLSGAFYVGWHQDISQNAAVTFNATGLDGRLDYPDVTHLRIDGQWRRFNGLTGDNMIRAAIYSYRDDDEQQLAPRRRRIVDVPELQENDLGERVVFAQQNPAQLPLFAEASNPDYHSGEFVPPRDPPSGYKVVIDDTVRAEGMIQNNLWQHIVGTIGENVDHTVKIVAVYEVNEETIEIESEEVVGRFNIGPGMPINPVVTNAGENFTIRWSAPLRNADGVQNCTDYAGCRILINGEEVAVVNSPTLTYSGVMPEGEEGWFDVSLLAFDEVPNYSAPRVVQVPLGINQYYNFDSNAGPTVFTATPFGSWFRNDALLDGPGRAHSGSFAWGTRQVLPRYYDNNADYAITTINEFLIESPNARLEFFHYLSAEAGRDGGQVLISVDGGNWSMIEPVGGYPDQTVSSFENQPAFTNEIPAWTIASFDLSEFQGHLVKFRLSFKTNEAINWYAGWFIDDFVLWGGAPPVTAQIYGSVRDQDGNAISNVEIRSGRVSTISSIQGTYRLTGIIPGEVTAIAKIAGIPSRELELNLNPRDSIRVDFDMTKPVVAFDPEVLGLSLGGNDVVGTEIQLINSGEITVPYVLRLANQLPEHDGNSRQLRTTSIQGLHRDRPGDVHFDFDLTQETHLSKILGVEYIEDRFFLTANDPVEGRVFATVSRDGDFITLFGQPLVRPIGWGLRDLATDGVFLYGSQNDSIYQITTDGAFAGVFPGAPLTVNRALAYDRESDAFWCGEYDLPWYLVDREGEVQEMWDGHGLSGVYGFAWHPADADGLYLYIANLEPDGTTRIYRSDPARELIEETEIVFDGVSSGLFITGRWDSNRWILGSVIGTNPQRLIGVELASRSSWITLDPIEGELEPDSEQDVTITLSVPPEAREGDAYEAEVVVEAFGGQIAQIWVGLEIVEGFRHFDSPIESENSMTARVLACDISGRELPIGSEIAVITPQDRVGGAVRWLEPPAEFSIYRGEQAFSAGDSLEFVIWDAFSHNEYRPEVEYIQGIPIYNDNNVIEVRLSYIEPDNQIVSLAEGWNLISSYITPNSIDVEVLFGDLVERNTLVMLKDGFGRFWTTRYNYNGLGEWNILGGYHVNVTTDESVSFTGRKIDPETAIPLSIGWNTVSYLLDHPVDAQVALDGVMEGLLLAKNGYGDFIAPRFGYFGLSELIPGEGYKLKVDRRLDLIYTDGGEFVRNLHPTRKEHERSTGSDMSVLITDAPNALIGDDVTLIAISVRTGATVGKSTFTGLPAGIVIHGDDTLTVDIDGAIFDDVLSIQAMKDNRIVGRLSENSRKLLYREDNFETVNLSAAFSEVPEKLTLSPTYPNPFNSRTTVGFGLPERSPVETRLLDLHGRVVWTSGETVLAEGWHSVTLDANALPAGLYWLEISAGTSRVAEKIVLLR